MPYVAAYPPLTRDDRQGVLRSVRHRLQRLRKQADGAKKRKDSQRKKPPPYEDAESELPMKAKPPYPGKPLHEIKMYGPDVDDLIHHRTRPLQFKDLQRIERSMRLMHAAYPNELQDVVVYIGKPDIVDELFWRRGRDAESDPWYSRIGGQYWQNKRMSLLVKPVLYPFYGLQRTLVSLGAVAGPHYSPVSNTATLSMGNEPVVQHELGHAVDFNRFTEVPTPLKPVGRLGRALYMLAPMTPLVGQALLPLYEANANAYSARAIEKVVKDPVWKERYRLLREANLPHAFGTYIGGLAAMPAALGAALFARRLERETFGGPGILAPLLAYGMVQALGAYTGYRLSRWMRDRKLKEEIERFRKRYGRLPDDLQEVYDRLTAKGQEQQVPRPAVAGAA